MPTQLTSYLPPWFDQNKSFALQAGIPAGAGDI